MFTPLLPVTDAAFRHALSLRTPSLGPADRLHAGTCHANEIETIVSADPASGGIRGLRRIDPLDARALRRLLESGG